ncbi:MAG: 30S ribosomal protein S16 [Saprospiraceae bacterium]|nr:30S ribosomal protein S16 [Saprospiraceae bacterium]HMW38632.1 30S ribosomal protein S16 [Saprospiraceae bacterium]HMX86895.1 30S ribosomal protein S16 [Saprospiraceae bacterium]HMZ38997.1 30S ribosomal protein S16 [Saprospiraceae bacterium]HNA64811.1 30S ribosomal protein S16 [Saprospiraceae bacterium]
MAVKIRLQRHGRKKAPYYHIVVADARAPRDGRFIEKLGMYNPISKPAQIEIDREKAYEWITKGAQPTDTVRAILRYKGVMFKKHLQMGVAKGAITQEVADARLAEWINKKEGKIQEAVNKNLMEISDFHAKLNSVTREKKVKEVLEEVSAEAQATEPIAESAEEGAAGGGAESENAASAEE